MRQQSIYKTFSLTSLLAIFAFPVEKNTQASEPFFPKYFFHLIRFFKRERSGKK
jgi:hypothetical protein